MLLIDPEIFQKLRDVRRWGHVGAGDFLCSRRIRPVGWSPRADPIAIGGDEFVLIENPDGGVISEFEASEDGLLDLLLYFFFVLFVDYPIVSRFLELVGPRLGLP